MAGLAALCAYAFAAEGLVRSILHAALTPPEARRWGRRLRLEPMLACMAAGFALCNGLVDRRKFSRLLHRLLSPCLLLFCLFVDFAFFSFDAAISTFYFPFALAG